MLQVSGITLHISYPLNTITHFLLVSFHETFQHVEIRECESIEPTW